MNLKSFQFCLQVHAQSGDCSKTQYSSQTSLYTRTQWQDLPLLGDERCLPDRVSPRREGPAAPAPAQPLSGEEKGDHKETPLLHWWDILMWCICAFYGSTLQICLGVSPVDWPRRWPSPFICFVSRFQLAFECCFLSCHSLWFASTQMFASSPFLHWLVCLTHRYRWGIQLPRQMNFLSAKMAGID